MKWTEKRQQEVLERGLSQHLHRVRIAHILEQVADARVGVDRPIHVLDVGCGDGVLTKRLRERFPLEVIEGLDADPVRLQRARNDCPGVTFRQGDVGALPYVAECFDVVLCHHVVEHVEDDVQLLRECYRVLAPGGCFILGIPHEGGVIGRVLRQLHRKMYAEGEHVHFYTIGDMQRAMSRQGFAAVHYAKFGFLFPHYYVHLLLTWFRPTFTLGHWISQRVDFTADSLIFTARKPGEVRRQLDVNKECVVGAP